MSRGGGDLEALIISLDVSWEIREVRIFPDVLARVGNLIVDGDSPPWLL